MQKLNWFGKFVAEGIGTFCLVFAGTSAIVINQLSNGAISHLGISLVFGLIVLAMIYAVGHISGAHMNPAVTLGFWSVGRVASYEIIPYLSAQLAGAFAASLMVAMLFGTTTANLGATIPVGSWQQSFVMEFILTFILMFVIMGVAHEDRAEGLMAGVAIGATIALEALIGGPISGASMNPVRSLAPAIISGMLTHQWIYCLAPILGSISGAFIYRAVQCHNPENKSRKGESMSKTKVLFVCIHNSARSQMAEALLKKVGGESFEVESAGLEPGKLNPLAVDAMKAIGIDISKKPHEARFRHVQRGTDVPLRGNGMRRNKRRTLPHFSRHNQAGSLELPRPFFVPRYL